MDLQPKRLEAPSHPMVDGFASISATILAVRTSALILVNLLVVRISIIITGTNRAEGLA